MSALPSTSFTPAMTVAKADMEALLRDIPFMATQQHLVRTAEQVMDIASRFSKPEARLVMESCNITWLTKVSHKHRDALRDAMIMTPFGQIVYKDDHRAEVAKAFPGNALSSFVNNVDVFDNVKAEQLIDEIEHWSPVLQLERNEHTRLHKLKEALSGPAVSITGDSVGDIKSFSSLIHVLGHTFVVKHNWAAAFKNAEFTDADDWRLPYQITTFEFRLGGRSIIVLADDDDGKKSYTVFFELPIDHVWYVVDKLMPWMSYLFDQIKAICIALDADVATSTVIRQPTALNRKREQKGKIPLPDYHVVDLARRHRVSNPAVSTQAEHRRSPRLHWRRGHWRHYEQRKTWIKWQLVGDPDMGFIQHHYSL